MMALMIIISLCNLVTPGHNWSHLVTIISVDIKDLNTDGLDDYYCSV